MGNSYRQKRQQLTIYKHGRGAEPCSHFLVFSYYGLLKYLIVIEISL